MNQGLHQRNYRLGASLAGLAMHLEKRRGPLRLLPIRNLGYRGRLALKKVLETALEKKAILLLECNTDDVYQDHAVVFLPYQSVIVCRLRFYLNKKIGLNEYCR